MVIWEIISIILLIIIAFQDFKFRAVSWLLFPLVFFSVLVNVVALKTFTELINFFFVNLLFVILQLLLLTIYFSFKERKVINITRYWLGWGDILFFVVLAACFSPVNFLFFYVISAAVILFFSGAVMLLLKRNYTVPLAGLQAMLLIAVICIQALSGLDLYDDTWLINMYQNG